VKPNQEQELRGVKVLVVDDDEDSRELLGELLQTEGAEVKLAADAAEGMTSLEQFGPDVLVSDIGMPGEDGYSFLRRCRHLSDSKLSRTPSIALTAYTRPADRQKAREAGFDELIEKPVNLSRLLAVVLRLAAAPRA
jgi:CheY-like chemotaxis protein